ncbi:unnamed protein product [Leptidea sinapis]|uniref:Uncharacterized protein n=1 Tax=Leptidea sinapis TaxID=189913 RepID=A0A5E4QW12_9NEOP|nr:unnamed protein product [Leptidea sinapis]
MAPNSEHNESISGSAAALAIIREEQISPVQSQMIKAQSPGSGTNKSAGICPCKGAWSEREKEVMKLAEQQLKEKEDQLKIEFQERLETELKLLRERFDLVLRNEQIRSAYMSREAHRERKEKISALQTQLECKNIAALMYVLCSERRKSKLHILRIREEYDKYIDGLHQILSESQDLILDLSRGYKTAARVDHEWKKKMNQIMKEFQNYVYHYAGGTPDTNQYFFDIPQLMTTKEPIKDDPKEDPCDEDVVVEETQLEPPKEWWELIERDSRPFIVMGDMAEFKPPQRRDVLKVVKASKTAPKKWKKYAFNNVYINSQCPNLKNIKDDYEKNLPQQEKWCKHELPEETPRHSDTSRRLTRASDNLRAIDMGSILKMITSSGRNTGGRATLLGARDSMEIVSTTRLREKKKSSQDPGKVVLNVGNKFEAICNEMAEEVLAEEIEERVQITKRRSTNDEGSINSQWAWTSPRNDSLQITQEHPPQDRINYEKRMDVDSFIRTLPSYMKASPFAHYEQSFEEYETCTPEQLEILKQRIEDKKHKERVDFHLPEPEPIEEWADDFAEGVGVQTSATSVYPPPCTCSVKGSSSGEGMGVFNLADLVPVKLKLEKITEECFHQDNIEFDRFDVIGQDIEEKPIIIRKP